MTDLSLQVFEGEQNSTQEIAIIQSKFMQLNNKEIFNAMQNPSNTVGESINDVIEITGFTVQRVEMEKENTGELVLTPRIVLITKEGKSYSSVSKSLYFSLLNICSCFGNPQSWAEPLKVKIRQQSKGDRRFYNLEVL